jgi:hypothetical protein
MPMFISNLAANALQNILVRYLTLPNNQHSPAELPQAPDVSFIALLVCCDLIFPELYIRLGDSSELAERIRVAVPITPMYK